MIYRVSTSKRCEKAWNLATEERGGLFGVSVESCLLVVLYEALPASLNPVSSLAFPLEETSEYRGIAIYGWQILLGKDPTSPLSSASRVQCMSNFHVGLAA